MEGTHQKRKEQINRWTSSVYKGKSDIAKPSHEKAIHFPDSVILFNSCVNYNIDEVKQLLDSGIDINSAINEHGLTAMHQACIDGNLEMVKFLVDNGADINRVDAESWTVLHAAAYSGNIKICEYLIEQGVNLEKITVDSKLAMDTTENSEIINLISCAMIKKNLDPQKCRNAEQQRMMNDIKKWICHNPKNVNKPISEGNITALHIAAAKGFVDIMKYLMELGADPNVVDVDMWTPLHAAAYSDKLEAVVFLCSLDNCNIDALTNDNEKAIELTYKDEIADHIEYIKTFHEKKNKPLLVRKQSMDWYNVIKESSQNLRKETEEISKETSLNNVLPLDITVENKIEQTLPKTTEKTFTIDNEENVQLIPRKHHGRKKVNDRRATGIEPNEEISEIIPNIKTNTNLSSLDDDQQTRVNYIIEKKKNNEAQKEIQRLQKTINECNAQLETTKKDNIRLKEENSSLIRVISRLSLRY